MMNFLGMFWEFAQTQSVWLYVIIFFGKLLEVSTSTLRIVLINRGIRLLGSLLAILEISLWVVITSTVMSNIQTDPLKILVYATAFGMGNFVGSWLDEKLAFGLSSVQVVVSSPEDAHNLCAAMRDKGFGITTMDVHGIEDETRYMIITMMRRKLLQEALKIINTVTSSAVITVSDVKVQKGGYLRNSSSRHMRPFVPPVSTATVAVNAQSTTDNKKESEQA